jgi:hypothetical protein
LCPSPPPPFSLSGSRSMAVTVNWIRRVPCRFACLINHDVIELLVLNSAVQIVHCLSRGYHCATAKEVPICVDTTSCRWASSYRRVDRQKGVLFPWNVGLLAHLHIITPNKYWIFRLRFFVCLWWRTPQQMLRRIAALEGLLCNRVMMISFSVFPFVFKHSCNSHNPLGLRTLNIINILMILTRENRSNRGKSVPESLSTTNLKTKFILNYI